MQNKGINLEDLPEIIFGAEDDGDDAGDASGDANDSSGDSSGDQSGAAGSSSDSSKGQTHDDADDEKTIGLRTALASERKSTKDMAKQLRVLQKEKEDRDLSEKTDIEQANTRAERATEKAEKLAAGIRNRDVSAAIKQAAQDAGFIDVSDALEGVDRSGLTIEQDDDDPSIVTLDKKAIEKLVKDLGTKKPHFLKKGTDDGEPSGSQFGGNRRKAKTADEDYKDKYPSLR